MFGTSNNDTQADAAGQAPAIIHNNPFTDNGTPPASGAPEPAAPSPAPAAAEQPADDSLMALKKQALQSLQPLVGQLDQTPEEKFKTTMMLIQATDNPGLVEEAYAAANQITDEKIRAQALLDVVNEINYFTHKGEK